MKNMVLNPSHFIDVNNRASLDYINEFCKTAPKFEYDGNITLGGILNVRDPLFRNMVTIKSLETSNIVTWFPDLVFAESLWYNLPLNDPNFDIGNVKEVNDFYFTTPIAYNTENKLMFFNKHFKVIDKKTLVVNDKPITINNMWKLFGTITQNNYKIYLI